MNHWSAEKNHNFNPPWVLRFDPTPGGKRNDDGTTSWSMTFPAIQFTEWVSEPEKEANKLAETLNTHASQASRIAELEKALVGLVPGSRDPDGKCWCAYGHNVDFGGHQPSCVAARAVLSTQAAE